MLSTPQNLELCKIPGESLPSVAMYWSYVVRNRQRWAGEEEPLQALKSRAKEKLIDLGVSEAALRKIAEAGVVEIRIPFASEDVGWAARILPWEFLISAATLEYRDHGLVVVRHLQKSRSGPPPSQPPKKLLFVQSAPNNLGDFAFDAERRVVETHAQLKFDVLKDPTRQQLSSKIAAFRPDVIHVSGVDLHQGARFLRRSQPGDDSLRDGLYLSGSGGAIEAVEAWDLAGELNPQAAPGPRLITFNFYNSAARIAALAVARGAGAAIGFQDEIDDALAELFFANFYECWRANKWQLLGAFEQVWTTMSSATGKIRGSGIVLWSAQSLIGEPKAAPEFMNDLRRSKSAPLISSGTADGSFRDVLVVDVKPHAVVNYSLLHNRNGLFDKFTIGRLKPGSASGIEVEVILYVGSESFPFRANVSIGADDTVLNVAPKVNVPLTSRLARSIRDTIQSSLFVRVSYQKQELHCDTYPVALAPVDEWVLNPDDQTGCLASFVLPRDPAVAGVIDSAQKYLMALRDDPGAGFDGYQSYDREGTDLDASAEAIDMQVRALWSSLSFDLPLSYINPPPNFTVSAQRLRTPSDTIQGRRGTCIDLALLFAACLEYVDIYPVIFLLTDHAFPGYWRSEESYAKYQAMTISTPVGTDQEPTSGSTEARKLCGHQEVSQLVDSGDLVPLETVWLTRRMSLSDAIDGGTQNLASPSEFAGLLDIKTARKNGVTPLPVTGEPI